MASNGQADNQPQHPYGQKLVQAIQISKPQYLIDSHAFRCRHRKPTTPTCGGIFADQLYLGMPPRVWYLPDAAGPSVPASAHRQFEPLMGPALLEVHSITRPVGPTEYKNPDVMRGLKRAILQPAGIAILSAIRRPIPSPARRHTALDRNSTRLLENASHNYRITQCNRAPSLLEAERQQPKRYQDRQNCTSQNHASIVQDLRK